jgi:hypothetical protein
MSIVDCHEHGTFDRKQTEQRRQCNRDRPRLRRAPPRVIQEQSDAKRPSLRRRKLTNLISDVGEQIAKCSKRETLLGRGRPSHQRAQTPPAGVIQARMP